MSIQKQPKLLLLICTLIVVLVGTLAFLLYLNPWASESTPAAVRCDTALAQADLSLKNGHVNEAEHLCLDALKIIETTSDQFQRARVLHALGLIYVREKKLGAAEETLRKATACLDQVIANNAQSIAKTPTLENLRAAQQKYAVIEGDLASVLTDLSRFSEAESAYKSALKANDLSLGSLEVQSNLSNNLAKVLLKDGKNTAADELEIESEANDLAGKNLVGEVDKCRQELVEAKISRTIAIKRFKAIALSAKRRNQDVAYINAQQYIGRTYLEGGQIPEAKQALEVVFSYVKAQKHEKHDEDNWLVRARISKAICCQLSGEEAEARELLQQASCVDGEYFLSLLQSHLSEAISSKNGDRYCQRLVQLYRDAHLEKLEKQGQKPIALVYLGTLFDSMGCQLAISKRYDEGNVFLHRAVELYARSGKAYVSRETASVLNHLGRIANLTGKYTEAERYYKQSLKIFEQLKPESLQVERENAASMSTNLAELASVYCNLQDLDQADIYYEKAFANEVKTHNWQWLFILGQYYQSKGDYKKAKLAYGRGLVAGKLNKDMPKESLDLIQKRYDLIQVFPSDARADLLVQQGKKAVKQNKIPQARAALMEAIRIISKRYGDDSLELGQCFRDVADIYYFNRDWQDAAKFYERALSIFDSKHVSVGPRVLINGATSYVRQKDPASQIAYAKKAAVILNRLIEELSHESDIVDRPLLSACYLRLAECYLTQRMYKEAESNFRVGVEGCEANLTLVPNDGNRCALATALKESASNYVLEKKYDLALPLFKRAIKLWGEVHFPPAWDHPAEQIKETSELLAGAQHTLNSQK